jgi:two-component system sensor histidine kinase VicK
VRSPLEAGALVDSGRVLVQRQSLYGVQHQAKDQIDQLRALNDYLDTLIHYSHEAIFSCDLVGRVRIWNSGAEKMYGYTAQEIVGSIADEFLDPTDFTRKSPDVVRILRQRGGSFVEAEILRRKKSGEVFPVHATYSSILDSNGEYIGFSVIERDVATHKALEVEKIKSARLRAITQTAVTANDQINTPLGVILGYAQFLQRKLDNIAPEDAAALEIIQQQVLKIKGIMNKLKLMSDPIVKNYSIEGVTMLDLTQSR